MFCNLGDDYTMKAIFPPRKKGKKQTVNIGIFYLSNCFYYTFLSKELEVKSGCVESINRLQQYLIDKYQLDLRYVRYVSVLPFHLIWRKSYYYPQTLTQYAIEQQVYHLLEHELPIEREQVWFDYCYQQQHLEIYAVRQEYAEQEIAKYVPLKLGVLDVLPRVLLRAFRHLSSNCSVGNTLYCYFTTSLILLLDLPQKTDVFVSQENIAFNLEKYLTELNQTINTIVVFQDQDTEQIDLSSVSEKYLIQQLPKISVSEFICLGCALWGQNV
ncbi:hypothetical protein QV07_01170 [Gallibacterium genomosp. 3]|uniref:Competence protein ComA n=2 Tax=Gallibacterium genomosp. 3 TaxID=505345 RepID=A0A1A7QD13_9PAST|nr:hypothetical protein QV07_01170 [Gallibacterium genomosp. 3]